VLYCAPVAHFIAELVTRLGKDEMVVSLTINNHNDRKHKYHVFASITGL